MTLAAAPATAQQLEIHYINVGSGAGAGCGKGVVINESSDALGTGNYVYESVELHYDK